MQIALIVSIFLISSIYIYLSADRNNKQVFPKLSPPDCYIILGFIFLYSILNFIHFASFTTTTSIPHNPGNNYLATPVFDEIYYVKSAFQYVQGISPQIWVHPQLAILIGAVSLKLLGISSFAWRIVPNIINLLLIPLMYIFAYKLFAKRSIAIIATFLLCCDFMHFVMGRYYSLEPFVTLFLFLEYYFLFLYYQGRLSGSTFKQSKINLFYAGIMFGLGISSKWNAIYSSLMIVLILIYIEIIKAKPQFTQLLQKIFIASLIFIIIPLGIYCLTYIPYAKINHFQDFAGQIYQLQNSMLNFNLNLNHATHPYSSNYWSWPLDYKPLAIYYWQHLNMSSSVVVMCNPAISWAFYPVVLFLIYRACHHDSKALFLSLALLIQYIPYAFIHRVSFIYYFYSVIPLLILSICHVINLSLKSKSRLIIWTIYAYLLIALILFIEFYPVLSGITFYRKYTTYVLLWFSTWNF